MSAWVAGELYFTVVLWSDTSPPFAPILKALGGKSLAVATNLSYAVADLLLLGLVCGLLVVGGRRLDRRFGILAADVRQRAMISVPIAFALVSLTILVAGTMTNVSLPAVVLASAALLEVAGPRLRICVLARRPPDLALRTP